MGTFVGGGIDGRGIAPGSLLGLFLLGTLDRRANAPGALVGMFIGLAAILCVFRFTAIAFTWYVLIGSITTFAVGAVVSRLVATKQVEVRACAYGEPNEISGGSLREVRHRTS